MEDTPTSIRIVFAQAFCDEVKKAYQSREVAHDRLNRLRTSADGLKAIRYDMAGGGSGMEHGDDAMFSTIQRIEDAMDEVIASENSILDVEQEFGRSLKSMGNQTYSRLLSLRYADMMQWDDIAVALSYSTDHCRGYMHIAALLDLYDAMPERRKMPKAMT